jgi:ClpP class serine protease
VFRGGPDKAPVGLIGEVTDAGIEKVQSMVNKTHTAFKRHVAQVRPTLASSIEEISTGDIFLGHDALDAGLVDRIVTSDEYIGERIAGGARVLKLVQLVRPRYPFQKPTTSTEFRRIEHKSTLSCFSSLDSFVEKAKEALDNVVAERKDGTALMAKAMGVKGASCSMPSSTNRS